MASTITICTITQKIKDMKEKPYQCNRCETVFPPKAFLMNYFKILIGENPHKISMYERALQIINRFICHLISHNIRTLTQEINCTKKNPYQCNKCETVFPPKSLLLDYFKTLIGENPCKIYMYERSIQHISRFISHLITHKLDKSNQIETFNPVIDDRVQESDDCYSIVSSSRTEEFNSEVPGVQKYECNECGESFSRKIIYYKHLKTHIGLRPFICCTCNKAYKSNDNLMKHRKIHSGKSPPHNCNMCDKAFWEVKLLKLHARTHIKKEEWARPYKCDICEKSFNTNFELTRHKKIHTGHKRYQCTYCGKLFLQVCQLNTHLRIHTGERPYRCEHCGHDSATRQSLSRHLETHTVDREKSHLCDICSKFFFTDRAMKRHKRLHTGKKPYKCRQCDMTFSSNHNLLRHERKHTGEKPFKCRQCSKHFYRPTKCCEGLPNIKEAWT